MGAKILISLFVYICCVFIFYHIFFYFKFDSWLDGLLKNIIKTELHPETVKFFIINIFSIILSDLLYEKVTPQDRKYKYWKKKYKDLSSQLKVFLPEVISEMCKYNIYSSNQLESFLKNLDGILPDKDIKEIESMSKSFAEVQKQHKQQLSELKRQMNGDKNR